MKGTENFRRVDSYQALYLDREFNTPQIPEEISQAQFEAEFNGVYDTIVRHLNTVGTATEDIDEMDAEFSLSRDVDRTRAITVVCDKHHPTVIFALQQALKELPADYVINLDSHPAYVSILRTGEVLGFSEEEMGQEILEEFGFPE